MLDKISHGVCKGHKISRTSGSRGMGLVVGLLQALFPCDTILTIEGMIIQDVEHPMIRCEILHRDVDGLTQFGSETSLSHTLPIEVPIKPVNPISNPVHLYVSYESRWSPRLTDHLRLTFLNHGLRCDRSILEACCNLLILVPASVYTVTATKQCLKDNILRTPLLPY